MIHSCTLHIGEGFRLPGAANPEVLEYASFQITLTVSEAVDTENWVTSSLLFLLDPSNIAKSQT